MSVENVRKAIADDFSRIAEIEIFNYRLNFYPIFRNDSYYFRELNVYAKTEEYMKNPEIAENICVYDDGTVKGFIWTECDEVKKLFVEPVLQGNSIGSQLLEYAVERFSVNFLWALEKNKRALNFYRRHGFYPTGEKKYEEDTEEYLLKLMR